MSRRDEPPRHLPPALSFVAAAVPNAGQVQFQERAAALFWTRCFGIQQNPHSSLIVAQNISRGIGRGGARQKMEDWRRDYNEVWPNSAIVNKAPIPLLDSSSAGARRHEPDPGQFQHGLA